VRRPLLRVVAAASLAGPTALAFFTGGYFAAARNWAGVATWVLAACALVLVPRALALDRSALIMLAGLGGLAGWSLLSAIWAPIAGNAWAAGEIVVLYAGALLTAAVIFRDREARRAAEPAFALGAAVVIGYGMSERLVPGLLHFAASVTAEGRLEQPLTYWNAMGELAAIGLLLCARLCGDATRPRAIRALAAAGSVLLGSGLYTTFSRGALFEYAIGMLVLIVFRRRREQLAGATVSFGAAVLGAAMTAPFHSVTALAGPRSTAETQGAIVLAGLVVLAVLAAGAQLWLTAREHPGQLRLPAYAAQLTCGAAVVLMGLAIAVGSSERSGEQLGGGASRLTTLSSSRYAYWRVALHTFDKQPIRGVGAGGWAVYWLQHQGHNGFAQDAHSLPLQTMAELGLIGLALLIVLFVGAGLAARRALVVDRAAATAPLAVIVAWFSHSLIDWDWQMPAVSLIAFAMAGLLAALAAESSRDAVSEPAASPSRSDPLQSAPIT
jgi:O-Antigen ligase